MGQIGKDRNGEMAASGCTRVFNIDPLVRLNRQKNRRLPSSEEQGL